MPTARWTPSKQIRREAERVGTVAQISAGPVALIGGIGVAVWWVLGALGTLRFFHRSGRAPSSIQSLSDFEIRLVRGLQIPACIGGPKPTILLPDEASQWSTWQIEAIIRHEESHILRGDHLWIALGYILCALQWFNPFAWMMLRRFRLESEIAADDAVLLSGCKPSGYAELLLNFYNVSKSKQVSVLAPMLMARNGFADRLKAVLSQSHKRNPMNKKLTSRSTILAALAGVSLAGLVYAQPAHSRLIKQAAAGHSQETRQMEIVQVGYLDDSKHPIVWDAAGKLIPPSQQIQHSWRPNEVSKDGSVDRYRHIVFRVKAVPGEVDPSTGVGSPRTVQNYMPTFTQFGYASSDYLKTADGWHYFIDHLSVGPAASNTVATVDGKDQIVSSRPAPTKDYGLGHLADTAVGVEFYAGKPIDVGSIPNHFSKDSFKMKPAAKLPDGFKRPKSWKSLTEIDFQIARNDSVQPSFDFIDSQGKPLPESMVIGSFGYGEGNTVFMVYYVGVAPSEIKDVRMQELPTFNGDLLNVPLSPKTTANP